MYDRRNGNDDIINIHRQRQKDDEIKRKKDNAAKTQPSPSNLSISHPEDDSEKEADTIARKVVTGQTATIPNGNPASNSTSIHRKHNGENSSGTSELSSQLSNSKGSGQPLDDSTRVEMESKMGTDFSSVKIHTGSNAHEMNENINAKAFAHENDIYFKNGNYNPNSNEGKELLAHELVHTKQDKKTAISKKSEGGGGQIEVSNAVADYYNAYERIFDMYKETLDVFMEKMETPTKREVNKEFVIALIENLFDAGSAIFGFYHKKKYPNAEEKFPDVLGPIGGIIKAFIAKHEGMDQIKLTDFYSTNKELWSTMSNLFLARMAPEQKFSIRTYDFYDKMNHADAEKYLSDLETRAQIVKDSYLKSNGENSWNKLMLDYARKWLLLQPKTNSLNKPTQGAIQVKLDKNWNLKKSSVKGTYGERVKDILKSSGSNIPLEQLGIPIVIKYHASNGEYLTAWINAPTTAHLYNEVTVEPHATKFAANEVKSQYTLSGIPPL